MTQLNIVIPGLCGPLPDLDRLDSDSIKSLVTWLARADQQVLSQKSFYSVLTTLFGLDETKSFPAAALSLLACDKYTEHGYWFHADPVHLQADVDHAILRDTHGLELTLEESELFLKELNEHFNEDGIQFFINDKYSWFLNIRDHEKISTTPIGEVISRNVYTFMPQGDDALFWKKLMNEVQMVLHQSRVNVQREENNKLPVNGVWFWGEGVLPEKTSIKDMDVYSQHSIVKGLSVLNDFNYQSVSNVKIFLERFSNQSETLLVLDGLFNVTCYGDVIAWQSSFNEIFVEWLEPILNWVKTEKINVNLYPCNGVCYQINRLNRFRFFRDNRISSYITTYE